MSSVCSLDIIDEIPMTTIYNLFNENLTKAEMLTNIFVFNASSWVEELNFVWGEQDLPQWNVRNFSQRCLLSWVDILYLLLFESLSIPL